MTLTFFQSNYGEPDDIKKERLSSVVHTFDVTIEKMNHIISFAEKERNEARDAMVLQKSNSTIEHGMRYIEALENMRQKTEAIMNTL